jgi:hypothetical protein
MSAIRIVVAAAAVLASGAALAESPVCAPLQGEYVALLRQSAPGNQNAIAAQLASANADAQRGNCNRFLFFGPPKSPSCPSIQATIARLQQQLGASRGFRPLFGPSPEEEKASLQSALQQNGCSVPSLSSPGRTLCVRTCDGYYFPINNRVSSSRVKADAAACRSMYGGAGLATLFVQRGDDVADARSTDGKRYGDQPFAFLYRDTYDAACHAELKSGMAALETKALTMPETPVAEAVPVVAAGEAALQAISAVQPATDGKRPVRFVGDAYYATLFAYSSE